PVYLDLERAVPCGLLVNELVTNAFKHAFPEPRQGDITVAVSSRDGQVTLVVRDNGVGLPPDFDLATVKSLGLQLVP
ncbi:sensor histidine kinase, partial [Klebsiella pneumoniae]|nr:sensor histidine kinase [Klebsiella pneumoniae]